MPVATIPRVQPIILTVRAEAFNDSAWLFEPKYDGFRGLLHVNGETGHFISKRGNRMKRFQTLADQLRPKVKARNAVLDGEIVCLDRDTGIPQFYELMRGAGSCYYAAFDVLWLNGRDLRLQPLWRRKRALLRLIRRNNGALLRVKSWKGKGIELFAAAQALDLEGIVAKRKSDAYQPTTCWYKIKNRSYSQAEGRFDLFARPTIGQV